MTYTQEKTFSNNKEIQDLLYEIKIATHEATYCVKNYSIYGMEAVDSKYDILNNLLKTYYRKLDEHIASLDA